MDKKLVHLKRSFKYLAFFYIPIYLLVLWIIIFLKLSHSNLLPAVVVVLGGNLFLGTFTQVSNYVIEKYSIEGLTRDFLYHNFTDCFFRCTAGLSEMLLYTICFAANLETVVAGYLLLKTVSIWQKDYNNKKEGLHTAILRTAIVISLLISLAASYYLKKFIVGF